jgi:hypothetical protein
MIRLARAPLRSIIRELVPFALALWFLLPAASAHAQGVFVDGAFFASSHWESTVTGLTSGTTSSQDFHRTVGGGGVTIGTWLTPRVTIRLETGWPRSLNGTFVNDASVTLPAGTLIYRTTVESTRSLRTVAPLLAFHTGRRHGVQLGYIGGAAFTWQRERLTAGRYLPVGTSAGLVSGPIEQLVTTETRYAIVPVVGLDADIAVGQHVAVVPLLRALAASDGLNLRSGVAARVRW